MSLLITLALLQVAQFAVPYSLALQPNWCFAHSVKTRSLPLNRVLVFFIVVMKIGATEAIPIAFTCYFWVQWSQEFKLQTNSKFLRLSFLNLGAFIHKNQSKPWAQY